MAARAPISIAYAGCVHADDDDGDGDDDDDDDDNEMMMRIMRTMMMMVVVVLLVMVMMMMMMMMMMMVVLVLVLMTTTCCRDARDAAWGTRSRALAGRLSSADAAGRLAWWSISRCGDGSGIMVM